MEKILVVGYKGKMGSMIASALQGDFLVVGANKDDNLWDFEGVNLVVDFGSHESSVESARFCLKNNIPLVIGSTGQTDEENKEIAEIAKRIPITKRANFSYGVSILEKIVGIVLNQKPNSIEIIEKHHIHKKDKPSGTAIELEKYINEFYPEPIKITSVREGEEMGEHEIIFDFGDEKLSLKHNVSSRAAFVRGVVDEVKKLIKNTKSKVII